MECYLLILEKWKKNKNFNIVKVLNGYFLLNKPKDISSFWAISRARITLSEKTKIPFKKIKVGHAGTLDPLAQGLLLCAVGKSTKMLSHLLLSDKKYIAELHLGEFSETDDSEGGKYIPNLKKNKNNKHYPDLLEVTNTINSFIGKIQQTPPKFSALKINGKRACDRVREISEEKTKIYDENSTNKKPIEFTDDEIVEIMKAKTREVEIFDIKILDYTYPKLKIEVHCGTGTYIRSLARDIGEKLQEGAYLSFLERTQVGCFNLENAVHHNDISEKNIKQFDKFAFGEKFSSLYISDKKIIKRLEQGQKIAFRDLDFENSNILEIYNKNNFHIQHVLLWFKSEKNNNNLRNLGVLVGIGELKHDILIPRKIIL